MAINNFTYFIWYGEAIQEEAGGRERDFPEPGKKGHTWKRRGT
jgi:hypothetical protein